MDQNPAETESVEQILSSIRQVIHEATPPGYAAGDQNHAKPILRSHDHDTDDDEEPLELTQEQWVNPEEIPPTEDILLLSEEVTPDPSLSSFTTPSTPSTPSLSSFTIPSDPSLLSASSSPINDINTSTPLKHSATLFHPETMQHVNASLEILAQQLHHQSAPMASSIQTGTRDDDVLSHLVMNAMKPYLEQWLQTHLPHVIRPLLEEWVNRYLPEMVQHIVEREIHALIHKTDRL